jgi:hypothetical protein
MQVISRILTTCGLPVELDVGDLAVLADKGVSVHSKAFHVAVIERNANVVLQESELRMPTTQIRPALAEQQEASQQT